MAQYFGLSWDNFENNVCSKFAALQQSGEFVDMTLAADGHLVKVHQLILGIASPYIKALITSAQCKHPVIFLNNVSFTTLGHILQYVYTGEVAINEDQLTIFFQAAKALQIQGIGSNEMKIDSVHQVTEDQATEDSHSRELNPGLENIQIEVLGESKSHFKKLSIPIRAKNVKLSGPALHKNPTFLKSQTLLDPVEDLTNEPDTLNEEFLDEAYPTSVIAKCSRKGSKEDFELIDPINNTASSASNSTNELQYTVSIRGSLQLILNRFIYNLFSKSSGGKVRRWRCVDYKVQRCPACTVTSGDMVVKRINLHNHPFHDSKILGKIKKKAVFSAIRSVQGNEKALKN